MNQEPINVLVLCTGNSARSIIGEAIVNRLGAGRFRGFSAGSAPKGQVHPGALRLLKRHGYPLDGLRSKSWDEFESPDAAPIDVVITVCDNAASEVCPVWPGHPVRAHWGLPDPASVEDHEGAVDAAFEAVHAALLSRIERMMELRIADREVPAAALRRRLQDIHEELADEEGRASGEHA